MKIRLHDIFGHRRRLYMCMQKIYRLLCKKQQRYNQCGETWYRMESGFFYTYSKGKPRSPGLPKTMLMLSSILGAQLLRA